MNIGIVISALEWAVENRREIVSDAEAAIHFLRRAEHLTVKHKTSLDSVLVSADHMLTAIKDAQSK